MINQTQELVEYCLSFYGKIDDSLDYFEEDGYPPMQAYEIKAVLPLIKEMYPKEFYEDGTPKGADSYLRELVRDFVLHGRGYDIRTEYHTCKEARDMFNENADKWKKKLKKKQKKKAAKGADFFKLWNEITKEADIKPKWFGFLSN